MILFKPSCFGSEDNANQRTSSSRVLERNLWSPFSERIQRPCAFHERTEVFENGYFLLGFEFLRTKVMSLLPKFKI